jgi:thioredoxin-related protein
MLIFKLMTLFVVTLFLSACATAEPTQTASDTAMDAPKEINWEKAKEMILSGEIQTVVQSHNLKVTLQHKDGTQFLTTEPELDSVMQIVKQCGAKCSNMNIMTE